MNANAFLARKAKALATGREVTVHEGHNTNTGATILWVAIDGGRAKRVTGAKGIAAVYAEVDAALANGEAVAVRA